MSKIKLFISAIMLCAVSAPCLAQDLKSVEFPKPPSYRVGLSSVPETQYIEAMQEKVKPEKTYALLDESQPAENTDLTYADLSIKRLSKEVAQELEYEEQDMVADLSLLWQGAAVQSDTINFALYKLANPDADKPDANALKKVLTTIASMSTLVGASMGSPVLAGSSLIGGNILGIMSQDTKALNYKYTKVSDADMIILIRKVEDLQQKAVNLYYDYMSAKQQLEYANNLVNERRTKFELAQKNNAARELVVITDAQYRAALDKQRSAKSEFFSKRASLEQFVGNETFVQFEQELAARESGENPAVKQAQNTEAENEYNNTIQQTENFKNSISDTQQTNLVQEQSTSSGVANISQMPVLRDMEEAHSESVLTGSSSNVENTSKKKKGLFGRNKKEKAIQQNSESAEIPAAAQTEKTSKKTDKYSTKGLIFIHDNDKRQTQASTPVTNRKSKKNTQTSVQQQTENPYNYQTAAPAYSQPSRVQQDDALYNFAPLDEIKVPELTPGGYSIHSGY